MNDAGTYALVGGARDYMRRQYRDNAHIRAVFHELIAQIEDRTAALDVVEQMLITGLPDVGPAERVSWLNRFWAEGLRQGHWAHWRAILESYMQETDSYEPDLRIAYGICLRRLADWEGAQQVFRTVAAQCGRAGRFAEQARALVEWSVLARNQGEYETALGLIGQARRYAERVRDDELLQSLALQEAQIQIQQGRAEEAEKALAAVPETAQTLSLQCEALLAMSRHDMCRSLARRALRLLQNDLATEASLYTIVGRSYEYEGNHDNAHSYLTDAVTLLERSDDAFSLARAQTNLAAVLIPMRRYLDADTLLMRAEDVQARLGDQVGLGATRHNRQILGGYIAR
jgi:tetratricopeptide (TPR) repeat protein